MKSWLPQFILFLALAAVFVFGPGFLLEADQFYHIKHAALYTQYGILTTNFPWTQFSVWKTYQADIWYGFHLLLIPFTIFSDLALAIKIAATLFTALALLAFYFTLKRFSVSYSLFWTLLFYFATPNLLLRLSQLRPNTLTIALVALLFSFLIKPAVRRPWLVIAGLSFAISFLHLSFFWMAPLITLAVILTRIVLEKQLAWRAVPFVFLGTFAGWLTRPNPLGAAKILYVQIVDLIAAKHAGVPLLSGDELRALDWSVIANQLLPILIIGIGAMLIFFFSKQERRSIFLWSTLTLAALFLAFGFTLGRRATDFLTLFIVLFTAYFFSQWQNKKKPVVFLILSPLFLIMLVWHSYIFTTYAQAPPGGSDQLKAVSLWLKDHSRPGDIVFHTSWDSFPMLFFWNTQNYYISGADPIFEYAYDPKLYMENLFLAVGGKPYTCESAPCTAQNGKDLYRAIAGDFHAKYIIVELDRNAGLNSNLIANTHFEKVFSTEEQIVYKVDSLTRSL